MPTIYTGIKSAFDAKYPEGDSTVTDNFAIRRGNPGSGNPYDPESLVSGLEEQLSLTGPREYPSQWFYDYIVSGKVTIGDILEIAPRTHPDQWIKREVIKSTDGYYVRETSKDGVHESVCFTTQPIPDNIWNVWLDYPERHQGNGYAVKTDYRPYASTDEQTPVKVPEPDSTAYPNKLFTLWLAAPLGFNDWIKNEVAKRLDSFTVAYASGYWHGLPEDSVQLIVIGGVKERGIVARLGRDFKERFKQDTVILTEQHLSSVRFL